MYAYMHICMHACIPSDSKFSVNIIIKCDTCHDDDQSVNYGGINHIVAFDQVTHCLPVSGLIKIPGK